MKNWSHYGDIIAIPFFAYLVYYFYNINNKTLTEYILYLFSICGLIFDIMFTYMFLKL